MQTFKRWLKENKLGLGMLGMALLTAPTAAYLVANQPSKVMPEVTYNIKMDKKNDGLYYTVMFNDVNFDNPDNPTLIRQYKREAMDVVIDTVVNMQGIAVPVDNIMIKTASLKGLTYEDIKLLPNENKVVVTLKQLDAPDNLYIR
jgi:hypothetical protein